MKKSEEIIHVTKENLNSLESLLSKANYELLEIWTPDEGEEKQVWFNCKSNKKITLYTKDEELLSTNKQIVSEVTDLWFELRAIRNVLEEYYYEPEIDTKIREEGSFERFQCKVLEYKNEWEQNETYWVKLFNKNIDPTTLAFLNLEEADKQNLTN